MSHCLLCGWTRHAREGCWLHFGVFPGGIFAMHTCERRVSSSAGCLSIICLVSCSRCARRLARLCSAAEHSARWGGGVCLEAQCWKRWVAIGWLVPVRLKAPRRLVRADARVLPALGASRSCSEMMQKRALWIMSLGFFGLTLQRHDAKI